MQRLLNRERRIEEKAAGIVLREKGRPKQDAQPRNLGEEQNYRDAFFNWSSSANFEPKSV